MGLKVLKRQLCLPVVTKVMPVGVLNFQKYFANHVASSLVLSFKVFSK